MKYEKLKDGIKKGVDFFKRECKNKPVRIIAHLDADGICSCALMIKALQYKKLGYFISAVQQLDDNLLENVIEDNSGLLIFLDIGSNQLSLIKEKIKIKPVLIIDHHDLTDRMTSENIFHINPLLYSLSPNEISTSGMVYWFSHELEPKTHELAHLAIIGAIGDLQDKPSFSSWNGELSERAQETAKLQIIKGLRLMGAYSKPLYKVLEHSSEYYIPEVTGSESSAIQFLQELNISPKDNFGWRKLTDLSKEEMKRLVTGILLKRSSEKKPEDILGNIYLLTDEDENSPTKDAKGFAALLNACCRLNKASLAIGVCLNDKKMKEKAVYLLKEYKKELLKALTWYRENSDSEDIMRSDIFLIINCKHSVLPTMIGTLASLLAKSGEIPRGTFILTLGRLMGNKTKASLRLSGYRNFNIDLLQLMSEMADKVDGKAGGSSNAAGAIISTKKETEFIEYALKMMKETKKIIIP
jgi:RecJ-like exonuclease